jgi:hypothetical protein
MLAPQQKLIVTPPRSMKMNGAIHYILLAFAEFLPIGYRTFRIIILPHFVGKVKRSGCFLSFADSSPAKRPP